MIPWIRGQKRKLRELRPYEKNPRLKDEEGYALLEKSLDEIGMAQDLNITQEGTVLSGHRRVEALKAKFGPDHEVDVIIAGRPLSDEEMKAVVIWLNKAIAGQWDMDFIEENWEAEGYGRFGFQEPNLENSGAQPDDQVPDAAAGAESCTGAIWELGRHVLMCGDATNSEDVQNLMGGEQADLVFTDPPYNVNYEGEGKETARKIENDNLDEDSFRSFLKAAFVNMREASKESAALYTCYASSTHREFEDALNFAGFEVKNQIIWVKLVATMGWGDYRWKHEPIFYAHQKGCPINFYGDRCQYTEWTQEKTDAQLLEMVKKMIEKEEKGGTTVWRFNREREKLPHPTVKPVALIINALKNSSRPGDSVLDLFGGSGSTLIACEKTKRKAYLMEMDAKYCQIIVKRWEDFTLLKARKR